MLSILRDVSATYCFKNRKSFAFFKIRKRSVAFKANNYSSGGVVGILPEWGKSWATDQGQCSLGLNR